ncbi:hypothetical protein ABK046_44570, partial [Streptomyces caeruleatus]
MGSALINGGIAGAAAVMKAGNALNPITAAHIQDNFLFIALSSLLSLSHNPIRRLYRRLPLR